MGRSCAGVHESIRSELLLLPATTPVVQQLVPELEQSLAVFVRSLVRPGGTCRVVELISTTGGWEGRGTFN